jgi:hypothetical protein
VFHMVVAKVDRDVANIAKVLHVCYRSVSLIFYMFFQTYVVCVFI